MNRNYHFDMGNSLHGVLGLCGIVVADDAKGALERLSELLPSTVTVPVSGALEGDEYFNIYLNASNAVISDIDEIDGENDINSADPVSMSLENLLNLETEAYTLEISSEQLANIAGKRANLRYVDESVEYIGLPAHKVVNISRAGHIPEMFNIHIAGEWLEIVGPNFQSARLDYSSIGIEPMPAHSTSQFRVAE